MRSTWQACLQQSLSQLKNRSGHPLRIAVLGVGNPFRSDDAAGVLIVRRLAEMECAADPDRVLIIEAGHAPENMTGALRTFTPGFVLFLDAADMGQAPGTLQWVPEDCINGMSASTHSLPLSMLARFLRLELGCEVAVLGIQPTSNEVGECLSEEVLLAVEEAAAGLNEILNAA